MSVVEAKPKLKRSDLIWSLIGLGAVVLSCFLLYRELRNISLDEIADSLRVISHTNWLLAAGATLVTLSSVEVAEAQGELRIAEQEWKRVDGLGRDAVSGRRYTEAAVAVEQARAEGVARI